MKMILLAAIAACNGDTIKVALAGTGGSSLGEAIATVASGAASLTFSPAVVSGIGDGVEVVIAS